MSRKTAVPPTSRPAPSQTASKEELIARFNQQAQAIASLNAAVKMTLTAGSAYTGVIEQYHQVGGFILAQRPANIRVIGQAPVVGTDIFDMESDGETFRVFIPSKNKFLVGPAHLERPSAKPIENLRPQHLTSAIFWSAIPAGAPVLIEQAEERTARYYVLTVVRPAEAAAADWEIDRKIWFDRADLRVARLELFEPGGVIGTDIRYADWDTFGAEQYPRTISVARPAGDYDLQIQIVRLTLNETIPAERFVLQQPEGTELVRVGESSPETNPKEAAPAEKQP